MFGFPTQKASTQPVITQPAQQQKFTIDTLFEIYTELLHTNFLSLSRQQRAISDRISEAISIINTINIQPQQQQLPDIQSIVDASALHAIDEFLDFLHENGSFAQEKFAGHLNGFQRRLSALQRLE